MFQEEVLHEQERLKEEQCNIQKRSEQLLSIMQQFKGMWRHCLHGNRGGRRLGFVWETARLLMPLPFTVIFGFDRLAGGLMILSRVLMNVTRYKDGVNGEHYHFMTGLKWKDAYNRFFLNHDQLNL